MLRTVDGMALPVPRNTRLDRVGDDTEGSRGGWEEEEGAGTMTCRKAEKGGAALIADRLEDGWSAVPVEAVPAADWDRARRDIKQDKGDRRPKTKADCRAEG